MRYTLELDIEAPRSKVVELFDNPENWPKWQEGFVSAEPIAGTAREVGSKIKIVQKMPTGSTEIIETMESRHLPEEVTCVYEAKGAWNRVANRFVEISPAQTRWVFETEFRCEGLLKILSLLAPGMFRRSSLKEMGRFKQFVEENR
jgi:hypothetical protein